MINIDLDRDFILKLVEEEIQSRVDEVVKMKYFMSYDDLAEYLNISKPVIEKVLIKNGLSYYRNGVRYLFKKTEVDDFLNDLTENMTPQNNDIKVFKHRQEKI